MALEEGSTQSLTGKRKISDFLVAIAIALFSIISSTSYSCAAGPAEKDQTIVDLAAQMHIAAVGNLKQNDIYVVGGTQELCLLFTNKTSGMWNPELDKPVVNPGPLCALPNGAKPLNRLIPLVGEGGPPPTDLTGPVIYHVYDPSIDANCGSILGDHYVIYYPDGHSFSFYLIGRLSKLGVFTKSSMCDYMMGKTETVHVAWTSNISTNYVAFSGNRVILYDFNFDHQFVRSTVVKIPPLMNEQTISISHLMYIIPVNQLRPLLNKVGFDPIARNEVLQHFIQSHSSG